MKTNLFTRKLLVVFAFFLNVNSFGQTSPITCSVIQDASTISSNPSHVVGAGYTLFPAAVSSHPWLGNNIYRSFVQFDLSSIPANAIVYNAELKLSQHQVSTTTDLKLHLLIQNWNDATITWNTEPSYDLTAITVSAPPSSSTHTYNVTSFVQKWIHSGYANYGLRISCADESTGNRGYTFRSSEYSPSTNAPELIVYYYMPIEIETTVSHCTTAGNDGSISVDNINNGTTGNKYIYWYNSTGGNIGTGNSIDGLSPGAYFVKIHDSGNSNVNDIKMFLVGQDCRTTYVDVIIDENLMQDVLLRQDNPNTNYGNNTWSFYNGRLGYNFMNGHFKYELVNLDDITFISGNIQLREDNNNYMWNFSTEDKMYLKRLNFPWNETTVTWNNVNVLGSGIGTVLSSTQGYENTTNLWDFDVLNDLKDLKQNPQNKFQFMIEAVDVFPLSAQPWENFMFGFYTSYQNVGSWRPKLQIRYKVDCSVYSELKNEIDDGYYLINNGKIGFRHDEEYNDQDAQLSYRIYDFHNNLILSNASLSQYVVFGDNRYSIDITCGGSNEISNGVYILEVVNEKNEKKYLKFKVINNDCN